MARPTSAQRSTKPLVVAHRAGNDLDALRRAERAGADLVEADVRLFRGRPTVRHLKTIGPIPFYWDRWTLASPFSRYLSVSELLHQADGGTELMLDLKGPRRSLAELVRDELEPYLGERQLTVCARWWPLLDVFEGLPVRRIASVGSDRQLRAFVERFRERGIDGVSVHEKLLDERSVADIRRVTDLVLTWPVNGPDRARALLDIGVTGLISDHLERLTGALTRPG
jgi:glycerophosphoryl diester phosphodiesterase